MYNVRTRELKEVRINVKMRPSLRREFNAAAIVKDTFMSTLVHNFVHQTIDEVKNKYPERFAEALEFVEEQERNGMKAEPIEKQKPVNSLLFSKGTEKASKKNSRAAKKDIADIKADAAERVRRKKAGIK
jgi:predicted ATP-binding protein involved in virulence